MSAPTDTDLQALYLYLGSNGWSGMISVLDAVHVMEEAAAERQMADDRRRLDERLEVEADWVSPTLRADLLSLFGDDPDE